MNRERTTHFSCAETDWLIAEEAGSKLLSAEFGQSNSDSANKPIVETTTGLIELSGAGAGNSGIGFSLALHEQDSHPQFGEMPLLQQQLAFSLKQHESLEEIGDTVSVQSQEAEWLAEI